MNTASTDLSSHDTSGPSRLIAVTGGIGAGKSVVCGILRVMGYAVYDCDSNARRIMDSDQAIIARISDEVCAAAVNDGAIDRRILARCVFSDSNALRRLNSITHGAVMADIQAWCRGRSLAFIETAILCESGLDRIVDEVWLVTAPRELRIERVMKRSAMTYAEVEARMRHQRCEVPDNRPVHTIVNDSVTSLISQIVSLLA